MCAVALFNQEKYNDAMIALQKKGVKVMDDNFEEKLVEEYKGLGGRVFEGDAVEVNDMHKVIGLFSPKEKNKLMKSGRLPGKKSAQPAEPDEDEKPAKKMKGKKGKK